MKQIKSLEELKLKASAGPVDCFIRLNFGLRSSKDVEYNEDTDTWYIFHHIDGSEQELTTEELADATNIIEALEKGALYQH